MNAKTYQAGQAHRAAINRGANNVVTTVGNAVLATTSYVRGLFLGPQRIAIAAPKPSKPAAKRGARKPKATKK